MRSRASLVLRAAAGLLTVRRLARAARRRPPLRAAVDTEAVPAITVVVPARDEELRLRPLLDDLRGAPGVNEIVVVDDESSDATAEVARAAGARVLRGRPLPPGWAGKAWALQQGIDAASTDWIVALDADTRPSPDLPRALVARARGDGLELVTVTTRFECPTAPLRWLHPALLTTLVYRFGPPDTAHRVAPSRLLANGQCMAFARARLAQMGGLAVVGDAVVEDVALVRHVAGAGASVACIDASDLLTTRMFDDLVSGWRGWSRSLALPGVEPRWRQVLDLAVVIASQGAPLVRVLLRRADAIDGMLLAVRLGALAGTRRAYAATGFAYWASPLADCLAVAALARGVLARRHRWRGRVYR